MRSPVWGLLGFVDAIVTATDGSKSAAPSRVLPLELKTGFQAAGRGVHWKHSGQLAMYSAMMHGPPGWQGGEESAKGLLSYLPGDKKGAAASQQSSTASPGGSDAGCRTHCVSSTLGETATLLQLRNRLACAIQLHRRAVLLHAVDKQVPSKPGTPLDSTFPPVLGESECRTCKHCSEMSTCAAIAGAAGLGSRPVLSTAGGDSPVATGKGCTINSIVAERIAAMRVSEPAARWVWSNWASSLAESQDLPDAGTPTGKFCFSGTTLLDAAAIVSRLIEGSGDGISSETILNLHNWALACLGSDGRVFLVDISAACACIQ